MKTRNTKTPRQKLIKACDTLFSKIIRKQFPVCQKCGRNPSRHVHHIFTRRCMSVRYSQLNIVSICGGCHLKAHEHPELFRDFVVKQIGQKEYDALKALAYMPVKLDFGMVLIGLKEWEKNND